MRSSPIKPGGLPWPSFKRQNSFSTARCRIPLVVKSKAQEAPWAPSIQSHNCCRCLSEEEIHELPPKTHLVIQPIIYKLRQLIVRSLVSDTEVNFRLKWADFQNWVRFQVSPIELEASLGTYSDPRTVCPRSRPWTSRAPPLQLSGWFGDNTYTQSPILPHNQHQVHVYNSRVSEHGPVGPVYSW